MKHYLRHQAKYLPDLPKFLIGALLIVISILNFGCKQESDIYYVKYIVDSSTTDLGKRIQISINAEDESLNLIIDENTKWETIIGPVSKGFKAGLWASHVVPTDQLQKYGEIQVSKNDGPFVMKAIQGYTSSNNIIYTAVDLEYTIDF